MYTKKYIIELALIALGKEVTIDPSNNKSFGIIEKIYDITKYSAIKDVRCHFAYRTVVLQKDIASQAGNDYLLPADFLLLSDISVDGCIIRNNIFRVFHNTNTDVIASYYADTDEKYFTSEFAKYLSLKLALEVKECFDINDTLFVTLQRKADSIYEDIKITQTTNNHRTSYFL